MHQHSSASKWQQTDKSTLRHVEMESPIHSTGVQKGTNDTLKKVPVGNSFFFFKAGFEINILKQLLYIQTNGYIRRLGETVSSFAALFGCSFMRKHPVCVYQCFIYLQLLMHRSVLGWSSPHKNLHKVLCCSNLGITIIRKQCTGDTVLETIPWDIQHCVRRAASSYV